MTEQEQIKKWREDFEQWALKPPREFNLVRHSNGGSWPNQYKVYHVQCAWEAWCEAKRNMPVVELPKPELCFTSSPSGHGAFAYVQLEPLIERLEKAGIEWISENPYPVKGE